MILTAQGWTQEVQSIFNYAGKIAAAVSNYFSKSNIEKEKKLKELREIEREKIAQAQVAQYAAEVQKTQTFIDWQNIKSFIIKNWFLFLIFFIIIFNKKILKIFGLNPHITHLFARKTSKRKKKQSTIVRSASDKETEKKLKVHGKTFKNISEKMKYLRSLRKTKKTKKS